jgi:hypothetical protein
MKVIGKKFGFDYPLSEEVKLYDREALFFEWENKVLSDNFKSMDSETAKKQFLEIYYKLK